jgi:hypothetical protein
MRRKLGLLTFAILTCFLVGWAACLAQSQKADAPAKYKYTAEIPPGIASPDKVETRLGTLKFFDGVPDQSTAESV